MPAKIKIKGESLETWRTWIEEELKPPVVAKPEVLYTLEAFLELINIVESKK